MFKISKLRFHDFHESKFIFNLSTSTTTPKMANSITHINPYSIYIVWKPQIEVILETYSMINGIDEIVLALDQFLKNSSGNFTTEINLAFLSWKNREQALFTFPHTLSLFLFSLLLWERSLEEVFGRFWKNDLFQS